MPHLVCTDALNPAGRPTPAQIKALGAAGSRNVFFDDPQWHAYHNSIKQAGLLSYAVLARESFGTAHWAATINRLPTNVDAVAIANEPDGEGSSSWQMSTSEYKTIIQACAPLVRTRCPDAKIVAGGLVSGQAGWLAPIADSIKQEVDFLDIHPYNKNPSQAGGLLDEYYDTYGIPLMVLEWNRPPDQIDGFLHVLRRTAESDAWFCWGDGQVPGFGLIDSSGDQKPEYHALKDALAAAQPPAPVFVLGFKQMADRHPDIIGQPLDPKEWGPWPNCSVQRSTNGLLIWGNFKDIQGPPLVVVGDQKGFISNSGIRYVWKFDHLERVNG